MNSKKEKILIVGPAWVGDMVMAHSLYQVLARTRHNPIIDVLAPAWTLPLLSRFPEVRRGIELPFGHGQLGLTRRWKLGKSLRSEQYDQAIILPRSLKSAIIPFAAKAKRRTGFLGELRYGLLNDIRPLNKAQLPRTIDRFVNLGLSNGEPAPETISQPFLKSDLKNLALLLDSFGLDQPDRKILGLCPGAEYGPAKQWPAKYFAEVAKRWAASGNLVCIFGSEQDKDIASDINKLSGNVCINLCGKTGLLDVVDLLSKCSTVVTNDSGLMHVAAATGTHIVAIYGASDPEHTPPLTRYNDILYSDIECRPCMKRTCRFGHYRCLNEISPKDVLARL